jgi:DNA replication protein DnaC
MKDVLCIVMQDIDLNDIDDQYELVDVDGNIYAKPNKIYWDKVKEEKYRLLLRKSGIPKFYHDIHFDDYKGNMSRGNLDKLRYMLDHIYDEKFKDINLYLWGAGNGTQKTASACNFGKECLKIGLSVKFMYFGVFINYLMKCQGFKRDEDAYSKLMELKGSDILILDDCFDPNKSLLWKNEQSRSMIISEIDSFLREAIYNNKRFVLTSNMSIDTLESNYGVSLYELMDRNFVKMLFLDSVKEIRKFRLDDIWKDMEEK